MTNANEITLEIQDVAFGGDGVGRWENRVVFVPGTLPGETVRARLIEEKKNFARAELVEVVTPSADRQVSPCPYFGPCPGCRYWHVRYEAQLQMKAKQIADLLSRIGKISPIPPVDIIPSSTPQEYRNKIKMHIEKKGENWKVGYIGEDNKSVVDIERCLIARPEINQALLQVRQQTSTELRSVKGIWLARADARGQTRDFFFEEGKEFIKELPLLKEEVAGKPFLAPFESFFQTQAGMLEKLVETVEKMLPLSKENLLIDAYSGVGLFTLLFAKKVKKAIGIEEDRRAIGCARENAKIQFAKNAEFVAAKVEAYLGAVLKEHPAPEVRLILDPPRTGCHPQVLEILREQPVPEVVYVSCNPATLARDLGTLCKRLYQLKQVTFIDMFPQTAHCEVVCHLLLA